MINKDIKIVFVDIDWTILDHSIKDFDMESIEALKQAQKNGLKVFISTARPYGSAAYTGLFNLIKPDGVICGNGGVIFVNDELIYQKCFDNNLVKDICKMCDEFNINMELSTAKDRFLIHPKDEIVTKFYSSIADDINKYKSYEGEKITHMSLYGDESIDSILETHLPKEMVKYRYFGLGVDIYFSRSSKGEAVNKVLKHLNIKPDEAMAFGDSEDDVEMFKVVKYGIAMGNASQNVKNSAYDITCSVSEHGIKNALIKYKLIRGTTMKKNAGVLLAISSLPGNHGIGDFGESCFKFIRWVSGHHYRIWQILPFNPVGPGASPYTSPCSNAIDIRYICLDLLEKDGFLENVPPYKAKCTEVDYDGVYKFKLKYLRQAFEKYKKTTQMDGLKKWRSKNEWVIQYATFQVFTEINHGASWKDWPKEQITYFDKHNKPPRQYLDEIDFQIFMQYIAYTQWKHVQAYAKKNRVMIIADVPFYVGFDSVDCWLHKEQFKLDEKYNKVVVGGVPPDAFSDVGQLWGGPIYDFEVMKKDGYKFLCDRLGYLASMCDLVRLDHFRAFDTYCEIPGEDDDARRGVWVNGPSYDFFDALYKQHPDIKLIAEDLGDLTPGVHELRDHYNLPGMYICIFEIFNWNSISTEKQIVYTGTHDNETFYGRYKRLTDDERYMLMNKLNYPKNLYQAMFDFVWNLPSKYTIFPLQDLLKLDNKAQFNWPGTVGYPNWVWKLKDFSMLKKPKMGYRNVLKGE